MMTNPHRPRTFGGKGAAKEALLPEALYDLAADVGETTDVIGKHPGVAARLRALAKRMREDIGPPPTRRARTAAPWAKCLLRASDAALTTT